MTRRRSTPLTFLLTLFAAVLFIVPALAETSTPVAQTVHGINVADMDQSVDPGTDFYRYANGGWLDRTTLPPDRGSYGTIDELYDRTRDAQLALLKGEGGGAALDEGSDPWKAVQFFQQGNDIAKRNAQGLDPLAETFADIDAITDEESLYTYLAEHALDGAPGLFGVEVYPGFVDSSVYSAYLSGPPLGLPNRDYYLEDDPSYEPVRAAYIDGNARFLTALGMDEASAQTQAQAIFDFERALAEQSLTREEQQDFSLANNPMTVAELATLYPQLDWAAYLATLGVDGTDTLIVTETNYLENVADIVSSTPIETVKDLLKTQVLWAAAPYLDEETYDVYFSLNGRALSGMDSPRPVEERVLNHINTVLGEAVGQLYVQEAFPAEAKSQIDELVDNVIAAYRERLEQNSWMTEETRQIALDKLDKIGVKVGYPDTWRSYEAVELKDSYVESIGSGFEAEAKRQYARVGKPVDRAEWSINPQEVNAYYDPQNNEIVFPAAILQSPLFDYQADPASNYGAIGYVIGHEITHGFDITGSQFDANGNLATWWSEADGEQFDALQQRLVDQYNVIEALPGLTLDGQLEVGENTADLGGIQNAFAALQRALSEDGDPGEIDGLTQDQRFFIAAAQVWRESIRDELLTTIVQSDEHAPGAVRGVQPSRNNDDFHEAFDIGPEDPMFLAPDDRVVIW